MQRQLTVMRHAKSSWAEEGLSDHERPLNTRGIRDAPRIADRLTELGWQPQLLVSSDARRTRQTAQLMLSVWEEGIEAEYSDLLYLAGPREVQTALGSVSEEVESLLVLGHNPGWESLVQRLSGSWVAMKTATAVLLQADCEAWDQSFQSDWSIEEVLYPRDLS